MQKENIELYKKWNDFEILFKKKISNEIKKKWFETEWKNNYFLKLYELLKFRIEWKLYKLGILFN